ncbi:GNAT family N-acetyltransferase [Mycoplasmatota bacterium]|nr:GNAT family N-acetyltransferase [Mycoplasmatota bacterium]
MELKSYNVQEIDAYVALFLKVFEKEPWNDKWPSFERAKSYLTDLSQTPGFRGFVATKNSTIVSICFGYIMKWWQGDEYFVKEFFVDDTMQNQGIGSILYDYMVQNLQKEKVRTITLLTEKSIPAFQFYQKKGLTLSEDTVFLYQNIS